jgi:hypothetical protein
MVMRSEPDGPQYETLDLIVSVEKRNFTFTIYDMMKLAGVTNISYNETVHVADDDDDSS